jgi:hypothetical protein
MKCSSAFSFSSSAKPAVEEVGPQFENRKPLKAKDCLHVCYVSQCIQFNLREMSCKIIPTVRPTMEILQRSHCSSGIHKKKISPKQNSSVIVDKVILIPVNNYTTPDNEDLLQGHLGMWKWW